ncbi:MAG TPA: protein kinase [Isosphaeraceae bacterium]|jgi:WD40 repeat protein|nr:protein kinase [Isosphaeraceae bacterium]
MAGRSELERDLRLALAALGSGVIQGDPLNSALRAWARSTTKGLREILVSRGLIDAAGLAVLEGRAQLVPIADTDPEPVPDPDATIAHEGTATAANGDGGAGGRYRALKRLGVGGLGEVWLAVDRELNRLVALKELRAGRADDPGAQTLFVLEAEVTGTLEHPGIVPVYGLGRHDDGRPFYAMRLIEGETLRAAIQRFHRSKGPGAGAEGRDLAFRRLLRSVIDACNAVAFAHSKGVVHRDLKPDNVMLGRFGETLVVDWGIAKSAATAADDGPGRVVGTPAYMSPEQAEGAGDRVGPASDVYGLGAILYGVLVGHGPFPEGDVKTILRRVRRGIFPAPRRLRKSVDPALEAICLKAMAREPAERYGSPLDLADALERWLADVRYRSEQVQALGQVKGTLARLCLERAHTCFGRGSHAEGMLWLARALEHAPDEPPHLAHAVRSSLAGWHSGSKLLERALPSGGEALAVAFCPDGRRLASPHGGRGARLWDVATGAALSPPLRHGGPVRAVAFRPDGARLATSGDEGVVRCWDALDGEAVGPPIRPGGPVLSLSFNADGTRLAAAPVSAGAPCLWDAETGAPIDTSGPASRTLAVAFAPDGKVLARGSDDGLVLLLDAATGRPIGPPLAHDGAVSALAFSPDGRRLLTGGHDRRARLWELDDRVAVVTLPHPRPIACVGFRPGGEAIATACEGGDARLWDAADGRPIGEPLSHRAGVSCLAFRPDGRLIATGGLDAHARLWCSATALPIGPPLGHGGPVVALAFSPDGRRLATGCADGVARCWKVPVPVEGTPERISCWVRVTTDLEFDPGDAIRPMDAGTAWNLRRHLVDLGGPPLR